MNLMKLKNVKTITHLSVIIILICVIILIPNNGFGQATVLISQGGTVAVSDGDLFYDSGDVSGNDNNNNYTITLSPAVSGERVCLDFSMFNTKYNQDIITIYDGINTSAPVIARLTGDYGSGWGGSGANTVGVDAIGTVAGVYTPTVFCSNNSTGSITVVFTNGSSATSPGFAARITTYQALSNPCNISFTTSANNQCEGTAVSLTATGNVPSTALSTDFNTSTLNGWTTTITPTFTTNICPSTGPNNDGSIYLWMSNAASPRRLNTSVFDVSNGGVISFDYTQAKYNGSGESPSGSSPCESPDINMSGSTPECVYVQYSIDGGGNWTTFKCIFPHSMNADGYNGCGDYVKSWTNMVVPVPAGAQTSTTLFRWNQERTTSASTDNWGIDNVVIKTIKPLTITITNQTTGGTVVGTSNASPYTVSVSPTVNTTYRATITDGTTSCFQDLSISVISCGCVPPSITTQPVPQTICSGLNTSFAVVATGASGYQWQVNTGSGWVNVANGGVYSGATSATLIVTGATSGMSTYQYRCNVLESVGTCPVTSNAVPLTINPNVSINYAGSPYSMTQTTAQPVTVSGGAVTGSYIATPTGLSLNATTGAITPSASSSGVYVVSAPSACGILSDTIVILVTCQDYQIQMYSDGSLGTPITKTVFGCADAPVCLGPQVMPETDDFNGGLPYTDLLIIVTPTAGDLTNLSLYRYNSSGVKVETLTVSSSGRQNNYFLRPTGCSYSIDKTNSSSGTYVYEIKDAITGALLASGIWTVTAGAESAQSALVFPTGTGSYSGGGVTNGFDPSGTDDYTDDRGIGYFNPATAGTGIHHIVYSWNNNLPSPNNCIQTDTITITVTGPTAPSVSDKSICYGTSTTITASSGTLYKWYNSATGTTSIYTGATFTTPILTTNTSYWVSNSTGSCESPRTMVTVTINPLPTVAVNSPTVCAGQSANVVATPDVAATYSYAWTVPGGATAPGNVASFNASIAGNYSVIITNSITNCVSANASGTVSINPLPTVTVNSPTVCAGQNASIVANPGSAASYTYAWTVPSGVTNPGNVANFNATVAGTYSVVVTNATTTCVSASGSGIVTINPLPVVTVNNPTACNGQTANVVATPDVAATYDYAWTVPGGATNPGNVDNINATIAGTYSVIISNTATTCVSGSASGVVTINPLPTVTVNNPSACAGQNATVVANPGTAGSYSYIWTVPAGAVDPGNVSSFGTAVSGTYSVVITDVSTTCVSASGSGVVGLNPLPVIQIVSNLQAGCEPFPVQFSVSSTPQTQSAVWNFGNGTTSNSLSPSSLYVNDGVFDVSVIVTDVNGCSNSLTENDFITVYPKPVVSFTVSPTTGMVNEELSFVSSYTQTPATWYWFFGDGNSQTNTVPTANYAYTFTGNYTAVHVVETELGCRDTVDKPITVITRIIVPNVLTPNNDGFNDSFFVEGLQFVEGAEMKIYNRWGKLIYHSSNYGNKWDGENHAEGVYFFVLTLPDYIQSGPFSGSVSLFR